MKRKKTAPKTAPGRPFQKGKDGRRGAGKKGRSGRRPFAITEHARTIFERDKLIEVAGGIARDAAERAGDRLAAIRFLADYAFGKPKQVVGFEGDTPVSFTLKIGDDGPTPED